MSAAVIPASWNPPLRYHAYPVVEPPLDGPLIALTFDDGPHAGKTHELLAVLKKAGVPATFFVVGKMADRYPDLIQDIAGEGHELANHTYTHPNLSRLSDQEVLGELQRTRQVIQRLTGRDVVLFRPPGGDFNRRTVRVTADAGYKMVLWSVLANDVKGTSPAVMRRQILRRAQNGAVVLMHSGVRNTVEMLPGLIAQLRQRGYQFVTMSTLLKSSSTPSS